MTSQREVVIKFIWTDGLAHAVTVLMPITVNTVDANGFGTWYLKLREQKSVHPRPLVDRDFSTQQ